MNEVENRSDSIRETRGNAKRDILLIDDDLSVIASLTLILKKHKFQVHSCHDPEAALKLIESEDFSLVLQDMNFSRSTTGEEGLALLHEIHQRQPYMPVVLMTAWSSIALAVQGMRAGATDFIAKPWDNEQLIRTINTAIDISGPQLSQQLSRQQLDAEFDFSNIIGESPALLSILATIGRVCKTDAGVLIQGESGTGKEVIADAIHNNSQRRQQPFIKVNLGGLPGNLFESEMFGHVKGAFTDAKENRQGRFSLANGGTLFLDEIGELDKSSQVKLLRVLQDQNFQMVGSSENTSVNVRIVAATNQNLAQMVEEGRFREDLFYRLNLITLELPPLRKRSTDIPLLATHHLRKISKLYNMPEPEISPPAMRWLQQQRWPGNVRQFCQTIERALLMSGKTALSYIDFVTPNPGEQQESNIEIDNLLFGDPTIDHLTLEQMEKLMIEKSLCAYQGNITQVADSLGLSRAALYRRIEKYGIVP